VRHKRTIIPGLVIAVTLGFLAVASRQPSQAAVDGDSVVLGWNQQVLDTITATRTPPTIAARTLAVVHTAIYDAWAAYDPVAVGTRLGAGLRQPAGERTLENKNRAISVAAYITLVDLFPARQAIYAQRMADLGYSLDGSDTSAAAGVGATAAGAVLDFRHRDGANQLGDMPGGTPGVAYSDYTGYQPVNTWDQVKDPDRWQPLCVPLPPPGATACTGRIQTYLTPQWGHVTPFALTSASQFRPPGPYTYLGPDGKPSGQYVDEVDKITQYSKQLDDTRKTMAEYWEDGPGTVTPPGHWNQFAQWVSRRDSHTVDEDARMFFALNGALLDASISAWEGKGHWDSERPITAVRFLLKGKIIQAWGGPYKGPSYIKGEDWIPYRPANEVSPPFAEYASGHSTFSAAAAEVLTAFTGRGNFELKVTIPAGSSHVEPGAVPAKPITLSWTNFRYAAEQAGLSRQYGGVHFEHGDKDARAAGASVGKNAWAKALTYFNGTAT
jgi:hypothetical protein